MTRRNLFKVFVGAVATRFLPASTLKRYRNPIWPVTHAYYTKASLRALQKKFVFSEYMDGAIPQRTGKTIYFERKTKAVGE